LIGSELRVFGEAVERSPVDVAELMVAGAAFEGDCYIKGSTGGYSTSYSRHGDRGDVVKGNICGGFGDEDESFVETVEVSFAGFDGAFYT
jgi:hypothetical protein